eukprot:11218181-Lingulodinium_polyedra.AAC.1
MRDTHWRSVLGSHHSFNRLKSPVAPNFLNRLARCLSCVLSNNLYNRNCERLLVMRTPVSSSAAPSGGLG